MPLTDRSHGNSIYAHFFLNNLTEAFGENLSLNNIPDAISRSCRVQHPGEASAFWFGLVNVKLVDYAMSSPLSRERDHW